jgi:dTDP-L-rhamnose 4-epimerase
LVFEDGNQSRDFTHVQDIVQANLRVAQSAAADGEVLNVGTGRRTSLLELAELLIARCAPGSGLRPEVLQRFREGDIRHCYADIARIQSTVGFVPSVRLEDGLADLASWAATQRPDDRTPDAIDALDAFKLLR